MTVAFRIYGEFVWPPTPETPLMPVQRRRGCVEIHYVGGDAEGKLKAFLSWRPGEGSLPEPNPPDPADNIFALSDAPAWFDERADHETSIWIHRRNAKNDGEPRVAFAGAFLFCQYEDLAGHPGAVLRWPLVPHLKYTETEPEAWATLIVGQPKSAGDPNDSFRFNFHFPTPVSQTAVKTIAVQALPFSANFSPIASSEAKALEFSTLTGGPILGTDTSFVFRHWPEDFRAKKLGVVKFAAQHAWGIDYVDYWRQFVGAEADNVARFWAPMKSAKRQCIDLLGLMGIRLGTPAEAAQIKINYSTYNDLSLQLPPPDSRTASKTDLNYRYTLEAPSGTGGTGKLRWRNGKFVFRLEDEIGGYLETSSNVLRVDVQVTWSIGDENAWKPDEWRPTITMRVHWEEVLATNEKPEVSQKPPYLRYYRAGTIAAAVYAMQKVPAALHATSASLPQTLLPSLSLKDGGGKKVRFALYAPPVEVKRDASGLMNTLDAGATNLHPLLRLSLADPGQLLRDEKSGDIEIDAGFPGFTIGLSGRPFSLTLKHDPDWYRDGPEDIGHGEPYFGSFVIVPSQMPAWRGRLASLMFEAKKDLISEAGRFRTGGHGRSAGALGLWDNTPPDGFNLAATAQLYLKLPVTSVNAISTDAGRNSDGRELPLLIPLPRRDTVRAAADAFPYQLEVTESIGHFADRHLQVDLMERSNAAGQDDYVILSQEPFALARFSSKPLGARGDAGSAEVATYSSERRIWEFRMVSPHYRYTLPPQSVGESTDKPRRLELHDFLEKPEADDPGSPRADYARPYRIANPKDPESSLQRRAVEFRLAPSADIWIRPSDAERGYFMPEWQAHDIFRQRGELGLGAALASLRGEFLYGLAVGVDVSKETGPARRVRIAEIEALTGSILPVAPGNLPGTNRWNALRHVLLKRQERLEVWADDPDSPIPFAPARFRQGVNFALRHTALLRAPVSSLDTPGAPGVPASPERAAPVTAGALSFRYHPQGLSGGALWPVESANLFRALAENPLSSEGTLEGVAFSALGGDAAQSAQFLHGKVTIISQTRNGFVESQRVEVIGRIGALWHRAKHVVVYERTVNPSAQFAPTYADDKHRTRSRRPVLRKVREFIEILEHERAYPDFPSPLRSCGFLDRVRFNSRIINVDSAWGRDVGNYGWEVPLWNRASAQQRPQVYPVPDVAFCCHAEGDGKDAVVAQECNDADLLYFFADLLTKGSDTNIWPVRLAIDYADVPAARTLAEVADRRSAKDPIGGKTRRPPVSRVLPGTRRFTWRLAPASRKVAINAGRSGQPLYVGLDSVSFMRTGAAASAESEFIDLKTILEASQAAADKANKEVSKLVYWDGKAALLKLPPGEGEDQRRSFSKTVQEARQLAKEGNPAEAGMWLHNWFSNERDKLQTELKESMKRALGEASDFMGFIATAKPPVGGVENPCDRLRKQALGLLHGKAMLVESKLRDWEADIKLELVPALQQYEKTEVIKQVAEKLVEVIRPVFSEATGAVGNAREGIEKARAILADTSLQIDAVLERTLARMQAMVASFDQSKPWSPQRRKQFHEGLTAAASSLSSDLTAELDEARMRLSLELDDLSQRVSGVIAAGLANIDVTQASALQNLAVFQTLVLRVLKSARTQLEECVNANADPKFDAAAQMIESAAVAPEVRIRLESMLTDARTTFHSFRDNGAKRLVDVAKVEQLTAEFDNEVARGVKVAGQELMSLLQEGDAHQKALAALAQAAGDAALGGVNDDVSAMVASWTTWAAKTEAAATSYLYRPAAAIDLMTGEFSAAAQGEVKKLRDSVLGMGKAIDTVAGDTDELLSAVQQTLSPEGLLETVVKGALVQVLQELLKPIPDSIPQDDLDKVRRQLHGVSAAAGEAIRQLKDSSISALGNIKELCDTLFDGAASVRQYAEKLVRTQDYVKDQIEACWNELDGLAGGAMSDAVAVLATISSVDEKVRRIQNDLMRSSQSAQAYGNRAMDAAATLGSDGLMTAPSNILRLYSAVSSAPELAALRADIDRLRSSFDELNDIIDTTRATALFDRLGDELKAFGLSLPFDRISDRLLPVDLSSFDIGKVFSNFGGARLDKLFQGYKLPAGVADAIIVTHDFDGKQGRAWVQVDINAPMPGRRSLFSLEVFKADFVDMHLTGQVRFDADKESHEVTQTGFGKIEAAIDLVVAGQSMVRFEKFGLGFSKESGLKIDFDPKNIRLNPSFEFVQDFLSLLFPDEIGGMRVIKRDGIPVGLAHEFAMPNMSINFATSGISNIAISNSFELIAYPDFVLSDRFCLSKPEQPFIFSFFIIGGTGYVMVEAEYKPFTSELSVSVDVAAGGSAAIGFSFGPFSGQVFITFSVSIAYRKLIGRSGGGLSIGAVLVIAGYVNVMSIATVAIYIMLRMTYRDSGQIDADGTLSVTIKISRFFKITANAGVQYKLRDGQSQTTTSSDVGVDIDEAEVAKSVKRLQKARN